MEKPYISSTKLSAELGVPASTIRGYRNRNGVFTKNRFNPPADEFIDKYINRKSTQKLSEEYGVDHHVISDYAKKLGIYVAPTRLVDEEQIQEIIDSYYYSTSTELAIKYGVSPSRISQIWSNAGLIGKPMRQYYYNEHYFSNIDSYDKAYFLGLIGSDGCIYYPTDGRQTIIKITISKIDIEILERFREKLESNKPIYVGDLYSTFEISSDIIGEDFKKLNLHNRKTYGNTIADIDESLMPHLIRGYFDGDGCILTRKDLRNSDINVTIAGYEGNLNKIMQFLEKRNIYTTFVKDDRKYSEGATGEFGSLTCPNNTSKYCFLKLIYENKQDCYLSRKFENAIRFINNIENSDSARNKQIVNYYKYAVCGVS